MLFLIFYFIYIENTFGDWFSVNGHSLTEITEKNSPVVSASESPSFDDSVAEIRETSHIPMTT